MTVKGQCLCGTVVFRIDGNLPDFYQCHCSLCRRQSGTASNTGTFVHRDRFTWEAGEASIGKYKRETGFRSWFCTQCGSTLPNPLRDTEYCWIPVGLLEGPEDGEVVVHIYTASRARWDHIAENSDCHEQGPEISQLMAILHRRD